jgi:hypothetical protein
MSPNDRSRRLLSRRNVLKSAGLAALLAPVLRARDALGGVLTAPRRVILIYSPNGPITASGPATGTETSFTFHDWWAPLQRHQADGIFLSNLAATGASIVPGPQGLAQGHGLGAQSFCGFGNSPDIYTSAGESIDQTIGRRLEAENRAGIVRSVVWGLQGPAGSAFCSGPGRTIVPELDPSNAWSQLFANFMGNGGTSAAAAAAIARQQSVLDFVNQDCAALRDALGVEGMRLLGDHCTTLRSMEQNLLAMPVTGGSCTQIPNPGANDWTNPENIDAQMAAFTDLIAMTLACELSHVIAFQFGDEAARNQIASKYGVPSSPVVDSGDSGPAHHPWTHMNLTLPETVSTLGIFQSFYSNQVALLVDKLKTTIDASGKPLLDSTVVLWISELGGDPNNTYEGHITSSVPAVVFGNGQGTFRTGRYIQGPSVGTANPGDVAGGQMMAQLLVSVIQYMGLTDVSTVGATGVSGPLTELT